MGTINLFPREWSRLGATLNMFLHKTRSPFHFHLNRYIYTKMNQSLMPTRRIDRDVHHQRGGLSVIICVVTLFLASLHLEPIDQLRCGVPFGFFFFFAYLIISSLTSYSLAVGNKEQMRWSMASTSGQPGLSAWRISCIMSARLFKPPDWRKTRGELGADAKPLLACRTMASRLAWVAGKAISCTR